MLINRFKSLKETFLLQSILKVSIVAALCFQ